MLQLSLLQEPGTIVFESHLAGLVVRAGSRGVAPGIIARAERATAARFSGWRGTPLDETGTRRVRAYFEAIIRRGVMTATDEGSRALYRRLVAASIEADLRSAGWDRSRAAAEALRTVGVASEAAVA